MVEKQLREQLGKGWAKACVSNDEVYRLSEKAALNRLEQHFHCYGDCLLQRRLL